MAQVFIRSFIGLGSNLDGPVAQVERALVALAQLPDSRLSAVSSLYRSAPIGPPGQDDYINAVAMFDTCLPPLALLDALQAIEKQQGRVRGERWGARSLDLDLLLYGGEVISEAHLSVPHPEMFRRNFVLQPLFELAPELSFPDGSSLRERVAHCGDTGLVKLREARRS